MRRATFAARRPAGAARRRRCRRSVGAGSGIVERAPRLGGEVGAPRRPRWSKKARRCRGPRGRRAALDRVAPRHSSTRRRSGRGRVVGGGVGAHAVGQGLDERGPWPARASSGAGRSRRSRRGRRCRRSGRRGSRSRGRAGTAARATGARPAPRWPSGCSAEEDQRRMVASRRRRGLVDVALRGGAVAEVAMTASPVAGRRSCPRTACPSRSRWRAASGAEHERVEVETVLGGSQPPMVGALEDAEQLHAGRDRDHADAVLAVAREDVLGAARGRSRPGRPPGPGGTQRASCPGAAARSASRSERRTSTMSR